jgi:hypothetical protein
MRRTSTRADAAHTYALTLTSTPAGRSALAAALSALADAESWTSTRDAPAESVALAHVLSEAWRDDRLERCAALLARRKIAPAIKVIGYRMGGVTWYIPSDGNHRAEAARNAGRLRIRASVGGTYAIALENFVVRSEFGYENLYRRDGDFARLCIDLTDERRDTLVALGVRRVCL